MSEVKKIDPTQSKGFVAGSHQPYTDYDTEIVKWLEDSAGSTDFSEDGDHYNYIFTSVDGGFYTHNLKCSADVYYTKEQFKEWIGMTKQEEKGMELKDLVSGKHVVEYRDGTLRLVLDVGWVGLDACRSEANDSYTSTMENKIIQDCDIIKVHELKRAADLVSLLSKSNLKLVWQRNEQTPEQIEAEAIKKEMEVLTERLKKLEGK